MLDRVYGHHHRDHLNKAARAIGFGRRRQSLAEPLAGSRTRPSVPAQTIDLIGGPGRTRLGSNSLTELLVFGKRAGCNAAAFAKANPTSSAVAAHVGAEAAQAGIRDLFAREDGTETVVELRKAMHDTMESGAGIYRSEASLQETCRTLAELRRRYRKVQLHDRSNVFNTDLIQVLELGAMLQIAEAMAHSAACRKESRGSHQRLDHPERDDANYLKHSLASYRDADAPVVSYCDVTITRSLPAERVYGGAAA